MKVLVTCPPMLGQKEQFLPLLESHGVEVCTPDFVQTMSEEELVKIMPDFDGWIIGDDPATAKVFEAGASGNLKAAVKWGIGVDNVDFDACKKFGISVTNTPNMFGKEVADIAMGYIIGLARETYLIDRSVRQGQWLKVSGMSLSGKKVAVVGYGDIGRNTVKRVLASEMQVTVYDPYYQATGDEPNGVEFSSTWPQGLENQDFIVFTCALNSSNHHMLSESELASCKDGVRIVNVARGPLIDQVALTKALQSGKVYSAALDVFETEPVEKNEPIAAMERCILGSHNSSNTIDAVHATNIRAINELLTFLGVHC